MVIVPDLKYVTVSIFPQGRFKIGLPSIKKYGILGFTKKTKNSSYSKEFKMELVEKCISGEPSSIDLGHQYDISSGLLRKWIRMYIANIELKDYNPKRGIYVAKARRKTTIDERKEIVNYCIEHNSNYKETAVLHDVSYSQVYSWVKKYDSDGEEGLIDKRGHHRSNRLITYFYLFVLNLDHLWQKDIFSIEFDMLDVYNDVTANY